MALWQKLLGEKGLAGAISCQVICRIASPESRLTVSWTNFPRFELLVRILVFGRWWAAGTSSSSSAQNIRRQWKSLSGSNSSLLRAAGEAASFKYLSWIWRLKCPWLCRKTTEWRQCFWKQNASVLGDSPLAASEFSKWWSFCWASGIGGGGCRVFSSFWSLLPQLTLLIKLLAFRTYDIIAV